MKIFKQTQVDFHAFDKLETTDTHWYIMLSEFIDNSISQALIIKEKRELKIKIAVDHDNEIFSYEDNAGGITHYTGRNGEKVKINTINNIEEIFKFYSGPKSKGLNKNHVGMKQALFYIGKTYKVTAAYPTLKKSYSASASLKKTPNSDGDVELLVDVHKEKCKGIKIEIWDFTDEQKEKLFDTNALKKQKKFSVDDVKNMILHLICEKYKYILIDKKIKIEFTFLVKINKKTNKTIINNDNFQDYIMQWEKFINNDYNKLSSKDWELKLDKVFSQKNFKDKFLSLDKTNIEGAPGLKNTKANIFYNKLINRKELMSSFIIKLDGIKIKINLGLLDPDANDLTTGQRYQGISFFQDNRAITVRPHKFTAIYPPGRGGADYRLVADVFVPEEYMEPDENKKDFPGYKKRKIKSIIVSIINSTKLNYIADVIVKCASQQFENKSKKNLKSNFKIEAHCAPKKSYLLDFKKNKIEFFDKENKKVWEKKATLVHDNKDLYLVKETDDKIIINTNNFLKKLNLPREPNKKVAGIIGVVHNSLRRDIINYVSSNFADCKDEDIVNINKLFDESTGNND